MGPQGPAGAPAGGVVYASNFDGSATIDEDLAVPTLHLVGDDDADAISEPGNYLVSVRAGVDMSGADPDDPLGAIEGALGLLVLGTPITQDGSTVTLDMESMSRSCLVLLVCHSTFAVSVTEDQPLDLDLQMLTLFGFPCLAEPVDGACETPMHANVVVSRMGGPTAQIDELPPMVIELGAGRGEVSRRELRGMVRQLARSAS